MVQRLQDVLSALYKPAAETRQVFALPRAEAERLPPLPSVAVISITAPERPPAQLNDFPNVLRLSFSDVDHLNPDLSARAREKLPNAFTPAQADAIRTFVDTLPTTTKSIVVHCEGGYSRSCAVALALHQLYGYQVSHKHLADANPSIVRMLLDSARGTGKTKKARR